MSDPRGTLAALQDHVIDRRRFLAFTGALAGTALYAQVSGDAARAAPPLRGVPVPAGGRVGRPGADGACRSGRGWRPSRWWRAAACRARDVAVGWELSRDEGFRTVVRRGVGGRAARARALGARRRPRPGARGASTSTASRPARARSPVGRTVTAPAPGAQAEGAHVRLRLLPGVAGRLLLGLPPHERAGPRPRRPPRRLHLRVRQSRRTAARATSRSRRRCRSTASRSSASASSTRSTRPTRTCRRRTAASRGWSPGTTTRSRTTTPASTRSTRRPRREFLAKRAAAYQAYYEHMPLRLSARPSSGELGSTAGCATATSPSSTCSTRASTAPTSRAATASSRAAQAGFDPDGDDDGRRAGGLAARRPAGARARSGT